MHGAAQPGANAQVGHEIDMTPFGILLVGDAEPAALGRDLVGIDVGENICAEACKTDVLVCACE